MQFTHKTFYSSADSTDAVPRALDDLIEDGEKSGWRFVSHSTLFVQSSIKIYAVFRKPKV